MSFTFKAKIYKVGINPCVKVPASITKKMKPVKGYIPVKGKILDHPFEQTLCPVKNDLYRLYVNGIMLKGAKVKVGQIVSFTIEQAEKQKDSDIPMPSLFKKKLKENDLLTSFQQLTPSRQKEVLRYLNNLKTKESLLRNVDRLINAMEGKT